MSDATTQSLPVIESCDGCGACCLVVTRPPFYHVFEDMGEEAWDRLERNVPTWWPSSRPITRPDKPAAARFTARPASGLTPKPCDAVITNIVRSPARCSRSGRKIAATPDGARASTRLQPGEIDESDGIELE